MKLSKRKSVVWESYVQLFDALDRTMRSDTKSDKCHDALFWMWFDLSKKEQLQAIREGWYIEEHTEEVRKILDRYEPQIS